MAKQNKQRASVKYFIEGDSVEIRYICGGKVIDCQGFRLNNKKDEVRFFEFVEKVGLNPNKYLKYKSDLSKRASKVEWL